MRTHLQFKADKFVSDDDRNSINPHIRGGKLAEFLSEEFAKLGYDGGIIEEDWGWMIWLSRDPFEVWLGCADYEEDEWLVFIQPDKPAVRPIRKFFKKFDTTEKVEQVASLLESTLLSKAGATSLIWWSDQDSGLT